MRSGCRRAPAVFIAAVILVLCAGMAQAAQLVGDGNLLKRESGELCSACHRTNYNTVPPGETGFDRSIWNNAIKMHSSEVLGSCNPSTYETMSACLAHGGQWTPSKAASWSNGWGVAGGRYGEFVCTTCHTSHDTANIYLIKEKITAPNSPTHDFPGGAWTTVDFRYLWGTTDMSYVMGNDADNHAASTRICEVCHSATNYHQYDARAQSDKTHSNGVNCMTGNGTDVCHDHKLGFKVNIAAACGNCHGTPPTSSANMVQYDRNRSSTSTGRTSLFPASPAGAHDAHYNPSGNNHLAYTDCNTCHTGRMTASNGSDANFNINIGFTFFGSAANGSYTAPNLSSPFNFGWSTGTTHSTGSNRTCTNIYCHSIVQTATGDALTGLGGQYATPDWDNPSSVQCGACHKADGSSGDASLMDSGSHTKHVGATGSGNYAQSCSSCHKDRGRGTAFHANGAIELNIDTPYGGSYTGSTAPGSGYGNCSSVYCHSDGKATPSTYASPRWGSAGSAACGTCHGANAYNTPASSPHAKHVSDAAGYKFACSKCHDSVVEATVDSTTWPSIKSRTLHVNKNRDVQIDSWAGGSYTTSSGCSATYCHSRGTNIGAGPYTQNANQAWSGSTSCSSCHAGTGTGPAYTNGSPKANSHNKHVVTKGFVCVDCHSATVNSSNLIIDGSKHVNKAYDVAGANITSYTWASSGGTCSTACHASSTPTWGSASTGCDFCHGNPPSTGAHAAHVKTAAIEYGSTSVDTTGGVYDFGCGNCHPKSDANHGNGTVLITLTDGTSGDTLKYKNDSAASYNSNTKVCSKVYCHSNGTAAGLSSAASIAWTTTASGDKCALCHGNSPSTGSHGSHIMAGIHFEDVFTGTIGLKPWSSRGAIADQSTALRQHGNADTSTTIGCNVCHADTVTAGYNRMNSQCSACHTNDNNPDTGDAKMVIDAYSTSHLNGVVDIALINGSGVARSKAQLRTEPASWTRSNGYKSATLASGDSADMASGDWSTSSRTCTTACHLNNASPAWGTTAKCVSCHKGL